MIRTTPLTIALTLLPLAAQAGDHKKKTKSALPGPGDKAPTFRLRALDGAVVRLDEIAYPGKEKRWAKKRVLLLDFFRTDCGPCRKALPELSEMHEALKARGVEVLMVALLEQEDGRGKLTRFLNKNPLPFRVAVDETDHFAKKYLGKSVKLPATFLIDREGNIVVRKFGAKGSLSEHFGPAIEKLLGDAKEGDKKT